MQTRNMHSSHSKSEAVIVLSGGPLVLGLTGLLKMLCTDPWHTREHKDTHVQEIYTAINKIRWLYYFH